MFAIVPLLAARKLGLGPGDIGMGFGLASVLGVLASLSGWRASRTATGGKSSSCPSALLNGASMILLAHAPTPATFIGACMVWGIASSVAGSAPAAYAADSAPPGMNAIALSVYRMLADFWLRHRPHLAWDSWPTGKARSSRCGWPACFAMAIAVLFARLAPETVSPHGGKV